MKIGILVEIVDVGGTYEFHTKAEPRYIVCDSNRSVGLNRVSEYLERHIESGPLAKWVELWKRAGTDDLVNCPEARLSLPMDIWKCKLADDTCPIQAGIAVNSPTDFNSKCLATDERKKQILETVSLGKYDGFHHLPGRYLCVVCENRNGKGKPFNYHYPVEMQNLPELVEISESSDFQCSIHLSEFPLSIKHGGMCAKCMLAVLEHFYLNDRQRFERIELEFSGR